MTILTKPLRRQLETAIKQAREIAEDAAEEAIARIGVAEAEAPIHLSDASKALRRRLRAHARTLGDTRDIAGAMTTARLQDAASYEIWHRMLFGRFLAERGLLIHPELGADMSVAELRDLAKEEGAADEWALAERYAAPGLPGVFKPDDPVLALPVAPEFSKRLRAVLSSLPLEVFTADDSLGWTYQFWRASEKDAVNAAGGKIGAAELPAVTQLFTEPYMVKFLLHNTLGAWWAGKVLADDPDLARNAANEDALRVACNIPGVTWDFLRFVRDDDGNEPWRPAAGTFPGWPTRAAGITYCDPCCGSGHFLVEAFNILAALRRREDGLSAPDAAVAVLKDNLHGLEIDGRCVQIAAFNVALTAWKLAGGPLSLPSPHIAWVGAPPPMSRVEMANLASGQAALQGALEILHDQFADAPLLGSLLEVGARDLLDADLRERGGVALARLHDLEPEQAEGAVAARGLLDAAALLGRKYVLLATNVPFLGRGRQDAFLAAYLARKMPEAKGDLATAMLQRMRRMSETAGVVATVMPQNWLFLGAYRAMRRALLTSSSVVMVAGLGPRAFETITGEVVSVALVVLENLTPDRETSFAGLDANDTKELQSKIATLHTQKVQSQNQLSQRDAPDAILTPNAISGGVLLGKYVKTFHGITTTDYARFGRRYAEVGVIDGKKWIYQQTTTDETVPFGGCTQALLWESGKGSLQELRKAGAPVVITGLQAWGKSGVIISQMRNLPVADYAGYCFDDNSAVLISDDDQTLSALNSFVRSNEYAILVRKIDQSLKVTYPTLAKVEFDLQYWKDVAAKEYPSGMPEPYSNDPSQWLFHGHPAYSARGTELHVCLARIAGYRWPAEIDVHMRLSKLARERIALAATLAGVDTDGILPLHSNGNDLALADRMRAMLAMAFGEPLSLTREQALVRAADDRLDKKEARDVTLEGWLVDRAFRQHCILFQQRPILWHIWDGMKDGFSAFLHYHRIDRAALDKLNYTLLGDWIRAAKAEGNTARLERAEQLQQKLAKIIEGESPYDIFVRWKPLSKQPLGWEPDLDDGVRLNIRPLMTAGVLREQPKGISWNKDRGTDGPSAPWYDLGPRFGGNPGDRINDHHTTLAEKQAARADA